ncbi:MAG: nucleotidyltransferase [Lentisphaerae bacterium]|nr:nucleotidyltransferase [Lentisphaerota bacterium]
MQEITLVVLAAGMGSRYGGLKQLDALGPNGESVMDYSVFDAIRAGFDRVVFIIRKDFEKEFREHIGSRYDGKIKVDYAFQSLSDLPGGYKVPEGREKPWGTGHAVYSARGIINGPFAVINADDFYGEDCYRKLAGFLKNCQDSEKISGCIATFVLENTLSENGSVSRGLCSISDDSLLKKVVEHTTISRNAEGKVISVFEGKELELTGKEQVSMNAWGFSGKIVEKLTALFEEFLAARGTELKSEFYLPGAVDRLINDNIANITVLNSTDNWFGVTYREDKPFVQAAIRKLIADGRYPETLF